ncbi:MAG TPA: GNAT family N-acetyltransferase [Acidobacteriaceae bacterium]|nr:GNAT family N-acetyltransferase [Acidobacteriaceae bacterium]
MIEIQIANTPAAIEVARSLLREYWASFGFDSSFQNFAAEVEGLPGAYASPSGRLLIAYADNALAGCGAFRKLDALRCEAKRVYVRPEFRGKSVGRAVMEFLIAEARAEGYCEMFADTMPIMTTAIALYKQLGFQQTTPYSECPTAGAIYLRINL